MNTEDTVVQAIGVGIVTDPNTALHTRELAPGVQMQVIIGKIAPENDGLMTTVLDKDGKEAQVPAASEHDEVQCTYPGGLVKWHQIKSGDLADLADKVKLNVSHRFQLNPGTPFKAPEKLATGETFIIGGGK